MLKIIIPPINNIETIMMAPATLSIPKKYFSGIIKSKYIKDIKVMNIPI
jgi:hypothetical protein